MNNNNFTLILFFFIIVFVVYKYNDIEGISNTFYFDNDSNYQYTMNLDKEQCTSYNCQDTNGDQVLLIGKDSNNNHIFKYKDDLYNDINDKLVLYNNKEDIISYYDFPIKVPTNLINMTLKVKIIFNDYYYIGVLNNNYYNQEYLLYEKSYDLNDTMDDKLFYYMLIKIINNQYTIMYELPPRTKIFPNEYIWASYGAFQIGPLFLK